MHVPVSNVTWEEIPGVGYAAVVRVWGRVALTADLLARCDDEMLKRVIGMEVKGLVADMKQDLVEQYRAAKESLRET